LFSEWESLVGGNSLGETIEIWGRFSLGLTLIRGLIFNILRLVGNNYLWDLRDLK